MQIENGKVVSLAYELTIEGKVESTVGADDPMTYLHGGEEILPGLEIALTGKRVGDKVAVTLAPGDAYGDYDDDEIEEFTREELASDEALEVGMIVEVQDEDGYEYVATVKEVREDVIILDFNSPLAGKTLHYAVEVVAVRDATPEELEHGHVHGDDWDNDDLDDDE